ncbi:MAG: WecB/TagA/CpsF family glycosyltransferase [Paludibacter sp.]|nr:WecB/TagA/CpsF family glycosyltransferase [Paludibacter sp.]
MLQNYTLFNQPLHTITQSKALISTLNAHSFNTLQNDVDFHNALQNSDVLLPDGISVVWAIRMLTGEKLQKIAGADLFYYEMERINALGGKCFFLGSSEDTLQKIRQRAKIEFPNVQVYTYSPSYKPEFNEDENKLMMNAVNAVKPDVLFVGMTAPKQEKWAYRHFDQLQVGHVCCIGAVFDFYAGTITRAPNWMIQLGIEWSYRLIKEPRRMWRRYLIGNVKFIGYVVREKIIMA